MLVNFSRGALDQLAFEPDVRLIRIPAKLPNASVSRPTCTRQLSTTCALLAVEITFEADRQGGVLNGPRAYFHDPDGTVLEFIDLTSYAGRPS